MPFPPVTEALARHVEAAAADHVASLLGRMSAQPGNPRGAEIHSFGDARAFVLRGTRLLPWANGVKGVTEANLADLPAITELYRRDRLSFRVDVGVSDLSPALASALTKERLLPYGHNATLFAPVARSSARTGSDAPVGIASSLSFERVLPEAPEVLDAYTEIYLAGFGLVGQRAARWAEARDRHENPALCLVLARVDGVPAGIGGLFVSRGVGYLGPAATLPAFRGRGVQSALIADRLARAAAAGCELVAAHASFGTSSHHNLERAGLRLLQTKTLWRPRLAAPKRSPGLVEGPG